MTLVDPYGSATAPVLVAVIVSSKWCGSSIAQFVNDTGVLGILLLLTLSKTACANKMADCIAPFMTRAHQ